MRSFNEVYNEKKALYDSIPTPPPETFLEREVQSFRKRIKYDYPTYEMIFEEKAKGMKLKDIASKYNVPEHYVKNRLYSVNKLRQMAADLNLASLI